jgi:hypothetical protein
MIIAAAVAGCSKDENEPVIPNTWTKVVNSPFGDNVTVRQLIYGGGKFIATASTAQTDDGSNVIAYSTDGVTWSAVSNDPLEGTRIDGIAYGNGRFVAVTMSPAKVAYSSDGKEWVPVSDYPFTSPIRSITYGAGGFVICDYDGLSYSTNGETWTCENTEILDLPTSRFDIVYSGNKYFACGRDIRGNSSANGWIGYLAYSTDRKNWSDITNSACADERVINKIVYGDNKFVASGYIIIGNTFTPKLAYSTDGIVWTDNTPVSFSNSSRFSIAYGAGVFIISDDKGNIAYSINATGWTPISTDFTEKISGTPLIEYGNARFILGYNNELFYSN